MAEHNRIYPVDVEAPPPQPPSAPVAPDGLLESQKIEVPTTDNKEQPQTPPSLPEPPVRNARPPRRSRRSCLCKCFCWTVLAFVILIVLIGATIGILYLVFHPKIPKYSLDHLGVSNFTVVNNTAAATFNLTITARNPNKRIGIYYEDGSSLSAWFNDYNLCTGSLPVFYQGHRNTTVMNVLLSGETDLGGGMLTDLQNEQQATGTVPLVLRGRVPVRVKLGRLKLTKMTFKVKCSLVVNSLTSTSNVSIRSSSCKFSLKL